MAIETTAVETDSGAHPQAHPLVGLPDGHVDPNGEKTVYEYDEDGNFIGWHKEAE